MQKPRPADGTVPHRRHARYHLGALAAGTAPLHAELAQEMTALYVDLKGRSRATEDSEDDLLDAAARSDAAEITVENAIRSLDAELARADRKDPARNAQRSVFPKGFGPLIEPEGDDQLTVLPALYVRVAPFTDDADVAAATAALQAAQKAFEERLAEEQAALAAVETRFAEEQEARRAIRDQLDRAYGRLRDLYKGRPGLVEPFFYKESKRVKKSKDEPAPAPAPAPTPAPAPAPGGAP